MSHSKYITKPLSSVNYNQCTNHHNIQTLIIDNYDSYTYNLYQLIAHTNSQKPIVIYNDAPIECLNNILPQIHNIVISPGPGKPHTDLHLGLHILKYVNLPILAVCLGHQGIAYLENGKVELGKRPCHGEISRIRINNEDPLFRGLPCEIEVVRYHSLIVSRVPESLEVIGESITDTPPVCMAMSHKSRPIKSVQFHPESVGTPYGAEILANFREFTLSYMLGIGDINVKGDSSRRIYLSRSSDVINPKIPKPLKPWYENVPEENMKAESSENLSFYVNIEKLEVLDKLLMNIDIIQKLYESLHYEDSKHSFWFDKNEYDEETHSKFSAIGDFEDSLSFIVKQRNKTLFCNGQLLIEEDIFTYLKNEINEFKNFKTSQHIKVPFCGGFVGFFGYEANGYVKKTESEVPQSHWGFATKTIVFDHDVKSLYLCILTPCNNNCLLSQGRLDPEKKESKQSNEQKSLYHKVLSHSATGDEINSILNEIAKFKSSVKNAINSLLVSSNDKQPEIDDNTQHLHFHNNNNDNNSNNNNNNNTSNIIHFLSNIPKHKYIQKVTEAKELIRQGESYEICLTNQLSCDNRDCNLNPLSLFLILRKQNPAPYTAFLSAKKDFALCCCSPEKFISSNPSGIVESKPIKGTRPRDLNCPGVDDQLREELRNSGKDRAENLMIVDLIRNDFGRVCEIWSVEVPRLMVVETFATVHQLVSTVRGKLKSEACVVDLVRSCWPGGSMTGAPKIRTMSLLEELEESCPRGAYSGALGFFSYSRYTNLCIIIRTVVITQNHITIGAGGAVTALSNPNDEYLEMTLKANVLISSINKLARFQQK